MSERTPLIPKALRDEPGFMTALDMVLILPGSFL